MNRFLIGSMLAALGALQAPAQNPVQNQAQNQNAAQVTVAFSNPSQPRRLVVKTMMHRVTIKGYDGKDAIIESSAISERRRNTSVQASDQPERLPKAQPSMMSPTR